MGNGKKPLLRELISDVQVAVGKIQTQNENQDVKMDILSNDFKDHENSSQSFRTQCNKNQQSIQSIHKEALPPIRLALYGLYSLLGVFLIASIIALVKYIMSV